MTHVVVDDRFNAPPGSGNGGYVCGTMAALVGTGPVTLHLLRPLRLGVPHTVDGGRLLDGDVSSAEASACGRTRPETRGNAWHRRLRRRNRSTRGVSTMSSAEMSPRPRISDAMLRDSAHMAGIDFTPADGRVIAGLLRDVGIDAVDVGLVSAARRDDEALFRAVLDEVGTERAMTLVLACNWAQVRGDLELAADLGSTSVTISVPTSPAHAQLRLSTDSRRRIVQLAATSIREAKSLGPVTTVSAEDGARTDPASLGDYVAAGALAGADRFRLAETVASLQPKDVAEVVRGIVPLADQGAARLEECR